MVLLSSPVLIWVGTTAFIDAWTMVFLLAALLCGLDAALDPRRLTPLLVFMGAFVGEAAASKYSALLYGSFVVVGVIVAVGFRREVWRGVLGALGGFLLLAGPWYAWTIHTTGDPLPLRDDLVRKPSRAVERSRNLAAERCAKGNSGTGCPNHRPYRPALLGR